MVRRRPALANVAQLLGMSVEQIELTQIGRIILQRDSRFANRFAILLQRIIENTGSVEYTKAWLNAAHDQLSGRSPLAIIEAGQIEIIEGMIHMYETGQPI